ncbi:hypothetical protein, partial [Helicobacter pylori]|uniref:hypothetical protein n=1 Tax=Helicobacter pylori TaxID=210 RepID=UPI0034652BF3
PLQPPKTNSPNPIRARYEKLSLIDTSFFILIVKNTQRHQFDYQHSIKNFYRPYKMRWNVLCLTLSIAIFQRFLRNKTLSLPQKAKKLKV